MEIVTFEGPPCSLLKLLRIQLQPQLSTTCHVMCRAGPLSDHEAPAGAQCLGQPAAGVQRAGRR